MFDTEQPAVFYGGSRMDGPEHRVWLRRRLASSTAFKPAVFCLWNPSVAGRTRNDPTATRGVNFAISWGCTDLIFVNLATQISTNPDLLDPDNLNCPWSDWALAEAARLAYENDGYMVAAWGGPKGKAAVKRAMAQRVADVVKLLGPNLTAIRVTASGHPEHPLYLPGHLTPQPWSPAA